jgi:transcriptional regulator EpsA
MRKPIKTRTSKAAGITGLSSLSALGARSFKEIALESLRVKHHLHLLLWLGGEFQQSVPHQIFVAAWGDLPDGPMEHDVVSAIPSVRTGQISTGDVGGLIGDLFEKWVGNGGSPIGVQFQGGLRLELDTASPDERAELRAFRSMRSAAVHGISDARGKQSCLYMFLNEDLVVKPSSLENLRVILPFVDAASRRVAHLPNHGSKGGQLSELEPDTRIELGLSGRELSIMHWVTLGKTNTEIGMILNISAFTVKNHLQRIFRKLDVTNRAQAVSKMQGQGGVEEVAPTAARTRGKKVRSELPATEKS